MLNTQHQTGVASASCHPAVDVNVGIAVVGAAVGVVAGDLDIVVGVGDVVAVVGHNKNRYFYPMTSNIQKSHGR